MRQIALIALKELRYGLRNRWVLAVSVLLAALAFSLAFLGSAPTGVVKVNALAVTVVSLSSLTIFLIPLVALLLSYDAVVGEIERGTMALLLAYPVTRSQVVVGKFVGHVACLAVATVAGYGLAGLALVLGGESDAATIRAFALMIAASVLLGGVFIAVGTLVSTLVRDRGIAGGIAVGVWLAFVLLYDMALLAILAADQGRWMTASILDVLLLLNPTDAYRLLTLTSSSEVSGFAGLAGLGTGHMLSGPTLFGALLAWIVVPLGTAMVLFSRRQV